MRLRDLTSSALAAASLLATGATAQDDYVTSISTYTITRTVERVVETTYATLSSSSAPTTDLPAESTVWSSMASSVSSVSPVASASVMPLPHYNGTKLAPSSGASGALYSSTASMSNSVMPQATDNAAARTGSKSFALAAMAGVIGLIVL